MSVFSPTVLLLPLLASVAGIPGATNVSSVGRPTSRASAAVHEVTLTTEQQQDIVRYWTVERMLHAVPPPSRLLSADRARQRGPYAPLGEPGVQEATAPSASSGGALWPAQGAVRSTEGKVFFSLGGKDYVCSASTVTSANRDLVVTAGHCVKDGTGAWSQNWIFVPGYRDGGGPYGGFTARKMYVPDQWSGSATDDYDVAMVDLSPRNGRHVQDAAGAQAIAFGQRGGRQTWAFGYPALGQYDGEYLAYCSGRPRPDPHGSVNDQGLRCDMTQGSSGGAWLTRFNPSTGRGVVTSVSSFKYADDATTMYGPYFGKPIHALYNQAQHG
jgi:hypothetical protein